MSSSVASSTEKNQAKVTLRQVPETAPAPPRRSSGALAGANLSVDMIVQSDSVGDTNDISFTLSKDDLAKAKKAMEAVIKEIAAKEILTEEGIAKLSIEVGIGMRSPLAASPRASSNAMAAGGINIQMISDQRNQDRRHHRRDEDQRSRRARPRSLRVEREGVSGGEASAESAWWAGEAGKWKGIERRARQQRRAIAAKPHIVKKTVIPERKRGSSD